MGTEHRGFASMDRSLQREIASKGGKAAHQKGTAHEWSVAEAREAGRKGGTASRKRAQLTPPQDANVPMASENPQSPSDVPTAATDVHDI